MPLMVISSYCSSFTRSWWLLPASAAATGRKGGGGRQQISRKRFFILRRKLIQNCIFFCEKLYVHIVHYIHTVLSSPYTIFWRNWQSCVWASKNSIGSGSTSEWKAGSESGSGRQGREEILPDQEDGQRQDCDGKEANIFLNFKYLKEYAHTREFFSHIGPLGPAQPALNDLESRAQ